MWADFQVYIKDASFLEEHFCHETFALSPLIPELYWFSWERLWSIFWLWSMVLLAYLLDDSLMWADFQVNIKMRLYERNIFVIETFALSPLIPELYWFSWESPWSIFWLWSMVLLAYLLDDSLMWADFQVYIKDASFREEHFCHWNFRSISSHSWVVLILVRKPLEYFLIMIHGPSSLFIGRLVDVSRFSSLYKRCVFSRGTFLSLKLSLYLLSFLSCIDSREKAFGVFFDYDPWSF